MISSKATEVRVVFRFPPFFSMRLLHHNNLLHFVLVDSMNLQKELRASLAMKDVMWHLSLQAYYQYWFQHKTSMDSHASGILKNKDAPLIPCTTDNFLLPVGSSG